MIHKLIRSGTFWTFVFGIVGIGLTILFYEASKEKREPVYSVKKAPSIIFDKENASSKIKLFSNDSILINENVYVSTIVIWNNGNLQIKQDDIRQKIKIKLYHGVQILDYKIIAQTELNNNFTIIPEQDRLNIDWKFFDPNFGFELQIIYSGNEYSKIKVEGSVLGNKVKEVNTESYKFHLKPLYLFFLIFNLIVIFKDFKEYLRKKNTQTLILLILYIIVSFILCFALFNSFFTKYQTPL